MLDRFKEKEELREEKLKKIYREEEEERTKLAAKKAGLSYVNLFIYPIDIADLVTITERDAREAEAVVITKKVKDLSVGVISPDNPKTKELLENLQKDFGYQISLFLISRSSFNRALELYKLYKKATAPITGKILIEEKYLADFNRRIKDINELKGRINELSTSEILDTIIAGGMKTGAGDIHIEPGKEIRLRYRIDGVLQDVAQFSSQVYSFLMNRIKLLSGLKINIRDQSQDGRFTIQIISSEAGKEGEVKQEIEVRVSILPEKNAETVVMRLLGVGVEKLSIDDLGLRNSALAQLKEQAKRPNGIILNTGPTGSGKTTTLYSILNHLNNPKIKIITVEDPVEYRLPGIVQTQVSKEYSFAMALRAIMRQNPNVIMVGEIRDEETAQIAIQAAMTGHLVLSTLHTNDAVSTFHRLIDLQVDLKTIPDTVNAVIAQRLVRKICPHCKEEYEPDQNTKMEIEKVLAIISPRAKIEIPEVKRLYRSKGCEKCFGLKYKGRLPLFEMVEMNEEIRKLILARASTFELLAAAVDAGMLTLYQDGVLRALEGITDMDEVRRVIGEPGYLEELYEKAVASTLSRGLTISEEKKKEMESVINNGQSVEEKMKSVPQEKLLETVVGFGLIMRGTDLHIEPTENELLIRYRVDGILQDVAKLPKVLHLPLIGEIKILGGMKTKVHAGVQEGRFGIDFAGQKFDTRLSIIVGGYGETAVIRILGLSSDVAGLDLSKMGIRPEIYPLLENEIKKPTGIILNTGPTGSGKTTTLYAILTKLNVRGVKIMTIEDPIEYRLSGILQTQINEAEGYTFAVALRSFLRQNPNIIMLGEIRDEETAKTAVQASLTGHLVLSTIHTNDAAGAVQRLTNMGVKPGDIASSFNAFLAQRLVRKLCDSCKESYTPDEKVKSLIVKQLEGLPKSIKKPNLEKITLYKSVGCPKCSQFGYKGQTGLFEILIKNEKIQDLVSRDASTLEIKKAAIEAGMITLRQDGLLKVLDGVTSLEEVERVTGKLEEIEF